MHIDGQEFIIAGFEHNHWRFVNESLYAVVSIQPDHDNATSRRGFAGINDQNIARIDAVAGHAFPGCSDEVRGLSMDVAEVV